MILGCLIAPSGENQMTADEEIAARQQRLRNVNMDIAHVVWLREIADELTRLRHVLAEREQQPAAASRGPQE